MVYNSEEVKDPSFIILEDDVLSKIVFKKSDGSTLVVPLADITDVEVIKSALTGIYSLADPIISVTYNEDGTVETSTEDGIMTTYTYNGDGTVATSTRLGVTRTYTYVSGNLTAVA